MKRFKLTTLIIALVMMLCATSFAFAGDTPAGDKTIAIKKATVASTSFIYDGSAKSPKVLSVNGHLVPLFLEEGYDFEIGYTDAEGNPIAEAINAGNYKMVITGLGKFSGSVTKPFIIKKANNVITTEASALVGYVGGAEISVSASAKENAALACKVTKGQTCGTVREEAGVYYVEPKKAGEMVLYFSAAETANYKAADKQVKIKIIDAIDLTKKGVVLVKAPAWTGEEQLEPEVIVNSLVKLVKDEDYTVKCVAIDNDANGKYGDVGDGVQVTVTAKSEKCAGAVTEIKTVKKAEQTVSFSKKPTVIKRGRWTKPFTITADFENAEIKSVKADKVSNKYVLIKKNKNGEYQIFGKKAGHAVITVRTEATEHYAATAVKLFVTIKK